MVEIEIYGLDIDVLRESERKKIVLVITKAPGDSSRSGALVGGDKERVLVKKAPLNCTACPKRRMSAFGRPL